MCFLIKLGRHVSHGKRMNPIDFGGQRSKVKVTMDIYGNKLVNTIETKLLCIWFPSTVFWEKNGNGWVHNIESVTKLLKCNVFAQVIYQKIGNFLYFSSFLNMHPKFLIILEILTTKMAQKRAQKVQKIAEPRGFRSRILHCSA